jgi:hypothetical protein
MRTICRSGSPLCIGPNAPVKRSADRSGEICGYWAARHLGAIGGYLNVFRPDCVLFDVAPGGPQDTSCGMRARVLGRKDES